MVLAATAQGTSGATDVERLSQSRLHQLLKCKDHSIATMRGINTYGCAVCIWGNKYPRSGGRTASQCSFVGGQIGPQATQLGPDNRPWGSDQTPLNCIFPPWKRGPGL